MGAAGRRARRGRATVVDDEDVVYWAVADEDYARGGWSETDDPTAVEELLAIAKRLVDVVDGIEPDPGSRT